MLRLSFSQIKLYKSSPLDYFYKYVLKLPEKDQETKWLHFGLGVHEVLEEYYNGSNKDFRDNAIHKYQKYNLKNRMNYDDFLKNIINGVSLNPTLTHLEEEFLFDVTDKISFVGYLDVLDKNNHTILDWKTGTYTQQKENDYKAQLLCYAWLYYKKYNIVPTKCSLFFTKQSKLVDFSFTIEQINKFENYVINVANEILYKRVNHFKPEQWGNSLGFFSGYHYLNDLPSLNYIMRIKGHYVYLEGMISPLLVKGFKKQFEVVDKNAGYVKLQHIKKFGMSDYAKYIGVKQLYDIRNNKFPIGLIDKARDIIRQYSLYKNKRFTITIIDERNKKVTNSKLNIMPEKLLSGKKLRDYQRKAVYSFIVNNGIGTIVASTGAGKTLIATEIVRRLDTKTLFIINQKELMYQTKKVFEQELGIEVGVIGDGVFNPKEVTVATVQTLYREIDKLNNKTLEYLMSINFAIADESHNTSCESYEKVFSVLKNTKYRLGITATPYRDDGQELRMWALMGNPVYTIDSQTLINEGYLEKPIIRFIKIKQSQEVKTNKLLLSVKEEKQMLQKEYQLTYESNVVLSEYRNECITKVCDIHKEKKVLIIVKSIKHGEILNDSIKNSVFIHGSLNKKTREKHFDILKKSNTCYVISTIKIASEGLDVPDLDVIINASANKGNVKTIQSLGRVLRKSSKKKSCEYIDFLDSSKFLRAHAWKRYKTFKKNGYDVMIEEWD